MAEDPNDPNVRMSEVVASIEDAFAQYRWYQKPTCWGITAKALRWLAENDRRERAAASRSPRRPDHEPVLDRYVHSHDHSNNTSCMRPDWQGAWTRYIQALAAIEWARNNPNRETEQCLTDSTD